MRIEKVNGLYRKPGIHANTRVPLLLWLPLLLIVGSVLLILILRTYVLESQPIPSLELARKHSWKVAVVGDIACDPSDTNYNDGEGIVDACGQKAVGRTLEAENTDAVLLLGDIQYNSGEFEDFERSFVPYFREITAPIYTIAGNHDYGNGTGVLDGYKKAFDTYFPGATYVKEGRTYYDFNLGPWKLYALDSNCEYVGGCAVGSPQYEWLTSKVSSEPICSISFWHHPVFTSGIHNQVADTSRGRDFWTALDFAGNDIVLNGHDHHYERFAQKSSDGTVTPDGMREFVVGTGGHSLGPVSEPFGLGQEKAIDDSFGYLYLELFPGRYEWRFKNIYGDVLDSGMDSCR